jgi:hypothetical protein
MVLKLARCDNQTSIFWNMGIDSSQAIFPVIAKGAIHWRDLEKWFLAHLKKSRELILSESLRMMSVKMGMIGG